ncbi:hypothetical protein COV20_05440 [Candidatus Woesearchaeota archaeon CG10_big_fil_rev_8_21_14_0_10_45_16]|nr:MAG: hypothetical protein COV20_05440 [Candidatus Woesearchaeota archaeon CG10_big_fil_rev_8_21_14_0_10_45_16]
MKETCATCDWTAADWVWGVVSELALYGLFWYGQLLLGVTGNLYVTSLILLVLTNLSFFACPIIRKHFL